MVTRTSNRINHCAAVGVLLASGSLALGQGAQMIMMDDSGEAAPRIMHFSMPDFMDLRQPDFTRRDVPTFRDKLVLSDDQTSVIERLIDGYLESFMKLIEEHLPKASESMRIALGGPGGENGEAGEAEFLIAPAGGMFDELGDLSDMIDPALAEMDDTLPRRMGIGVDVNIGGSGEEGAPPDGPPRAGVVISLEGPDGEEVPEEVRKRMEEAATRIAEQLQKRLEEQQAQGGEAGGPLLPLGGQMRMEEIEQRQAEMAKIADEFRKAKASLRQKFVTDAQSYLATEQVERWPILERTLLRQRSLPKGRLAGERLDLTRVLGEVDLDDSEREALADDLESYEVALDHALKQRDSFLTTANRNIDEAMRNGDPDKAMSIVDRATALRAAVKAINMQHADLFASKMPAGKSESFVDLVRKVSYPNVYRTTHAQRAFTAAGKLEDLDDTARSSIESLEKAYAAELANVNTQLRQVIDRHQPLEAREPFENTKRVMVGEGREPGAGMHRESNPIREGFERRRELDRKYMKLLTDLLTPDQAAQLPKPPTPRAGQPIIIRRDAAAD